MCQKAEPFIFHLSVIVFFSFGWKVSRKYPGYTGLQSSILVPTLFLIFMKDHSDTFTFNIAIYADDNFTLNMIELMICGNNWN